MAAITDTLLITSEEVQQLVPGARDLVRTLAMEPAIHTAQRAFLRVVLGRYLYEEIVDQAASNGLTTDNQELVDRAKVMLAYTTLQKDLPFRANQIRDTGVVALTTGGVTRELSGYKTVLDAIGANIDTERAIFEDWLADNSNRYPLWHHTNYWQLMYDDCRLERWHGRPERGTGNVRFFSVGGRATTGQRADPTSRGYWRRHWNTY
jgi:hypothetical protein